jgi:hypothetical protein
LPAAGEQPGQEAVIDPCLLGEAAQTEPSAFVPDGSEGGLRLAVPLLPGNIEGSGGSGEFGEQRLGGMTLTGEDHREVLPGQPGFAGEGLPAVCCRRLADHGKHPFPPFRRGAVFGLTTPDASQIATDPQPITVARLEQLPAPPDPDRRESSRWRSVETTVYRVTAHLTAIRHERDGDLHLILEDGPAHMIAEVPSSRCIGGSRFSAQLRTVRRAIASHFGYVRRPIFPNIPVTVTGIGFFDRLHDQDGVAPNGIELHPVLSISFGQ